MNGFKEIIIISVGDEMKLSCGFALTVAPTIIILIDWSIILLGLVLMRSP